jgi:glucose-6-phosphate 1-dehydrogenase
VEEQMENDRAFVQYVINSAGDLNHTDLIPSLFPKTIQGIISERVGSSDEEPTGKEVSGLVAAVMFAGTDLEERNDNFMKHFVKKLYHYPTTQFFKAQQDLSRFLFGISVDNVSNIVGKRTTQIHTELTDILAAHSYFRKSSCML